MTNPFVNHSMWWGIVARFTLIITAGYLAALIIRVPIWLATDGPYWGVWWPLPIHFLTGSISGWIWGSWALGHRWKKHYGY